MTAKSNIHNPRRDAATPAINMYAEPMPFWTQIEPTQTRRNDHCEQKAQRKAFQKLPDVTVLERRKHSFNDVWMTSDDQQLCEL